MGKPAATDRRCLPSLSHSFTLDFVVLCNGTKAQALDMKEELKDILDHMGLKLSEEKTKVTHITEGFKFLGYTVIREIGETERWCLRYLYQKVLSRSFNTRHIAFLPHAP
jgi:hypothetical protein